MPDQPDAQDTPQPDRAAVVAQAFRDGYRKTSEATGISEGTLRSWVARHRNGSLKQAGQTATQRAATDCHATATALPQARSGFVGVTLSKQPVAAASPRARDSRGEAYLDKMMTKLERCLNEVETDPEFPHRAAQALQKLESAGRVPFGYGLPAATGGGGNTLINIGLHSDRRQKQPDVEVLDLDDVEVEPVTDKETPPTE